MPVPVHLPSIDKFHVDQRKPSLCDLHGLPLLPKVYPEDRKVPEAQKFFKFPASSRYTYLRLLGHGAYGYVCAAIDSETGMPVAVKRINQINNELVARRTLRELCLLRHFQGHPNITNIRDIVPPVNGAFEEVYISQELMDADLCHVIQPRFPITEEHVRLFLFQMLCGLKAMHSAQVIHRDLKPGNILWKHTGELKLCDFGLARGLSETMDGMDSTMTAYVATRWYRPPEILLSRSRYGKPLDMWSVGCIFAELLGRRIFLPGQTGIDQLNLIIQKLGSPTAHEVAQVPSAKARAYLSRLPPYPRHPLAARFPNASGDAVDLLDRMLQFEPSNRISVDDALAHPFVCRLQRTCPAPALAAYPPFDFSFDVRCKSLADLKSAILDEVRVYHCLASHGLPSSLAALQVCEHEEDERVVDGLLHRHIQLHHRFNPNK